MKTYPPEGVALAAAAEPLATAELAEADAPLALALPLADAPLALALALAPPVVLSVSFSDPQSQNSRVARRGAGGQSARRGGGSCCLESGKASVA